MNLWQRGGFKIAVVFAGAVAFSHVDAVTINEVRAFRASDFLDSIGSQTAISTRGEVFEKTIQCCKYLGVRWLRSGIEGDIPTNQLLQIHRETGIRFSWGFGSGSSDLAKLLTTSRPLAKAGALLAFEGPNEPNNWGITYDGQSSQKDHTWLPIAKLMRDLYKSVKSDPLLKAMPVWSISEPGAETDNVGLQFLKIPGGADTTMPAGTQYADFANVHNYIYHPNAPVPTDNKTWNVSDPSSACKVDGLFGEYGTTWGRHFPGYSERELEKLPRVSTETGCSIDGSVTEQTQGVNLLTLYLDQFARGWSYTAPYLLRDRVDEGGNQRFGFYTPDYRPRLAATYIHNLTAILADKGKSLNPGYLKFSISPLPPTVHYLVLQKSDKTYDLVIWDERLSTDDLVTINWPKRAGSVVPYDPTKGTEPLSLIRGNETTLTLRDHPQILEFRSPS